MIMYIKSRKKRFKLFHLRIKKENVIYMPSESNKKYTSNMLEYNIPCVCGSLTHSKFTHVDCLLNTQYDDVIS